MGSRVSVISGVAFLVSLLFIGFVVISKLVPSGLSVWIYLRKWKYDLNVEEYKRL